MSVARITGHLTKLNGGGLTGSAWRVRDGHPVGTRIYPPGMTSLAAILLPALAGLGTAIWTAGGRAALERRAAEQELNLAERLPESDTRRQLELLAEERLTLYAYRRLGPGRGRKFHLVMASALAASLLLLVLCATIADNSPAWLSLLVTSLEFAALIASFAVATFWGVESWRDNAAGQRGLDLVLARNRIASSGSSADDHCAPRSTREALQPRLPQRKL